MRRNVILPNIITGLNFLFGIFSLMLVLNDEFVSAAICIFFSMLFDLLDGHVARRSNGTSKFGVEFDSMSDLVSFGIAPGILSFSYYLRELDEFGVIVSCVYMLSAGIRLAKFNVTAKTSGKKAFSGLPSPAAAGIVCSSLILVNKYDYIILSKMFPLIVFSAGLLMISNVKYPVPVGFLYIIKNKITGWARVAFAAVFIIMLFKFTEIFLNSIFVTYTFFGIARSVFVKVYPAIPVKVASFKPVKKPFQKN